MTESSPKSSLTKKIFRALLALILCPIVLLWALIAALYIPAVQKMAVEKVCRWVGENSEYQMSIGAFHLQFPLTATIDSFLIKKDSATILEGRQIKADIHPAALLRGAVEVNYITIDHTQIDTRDLIQSTHIKGSIGNFRVTARSIHPSRKSIGLRRVYLADSNFDVTLSPTKEDEDSTKNNNDWIITLRKGVINNVGVNITIPDDTIAISTKIGQFKIADATADLGSEKFGVQTLTLKHSSAQYNRGTQPDSIAPLDHLWATDIGLSAGPLSYCPTGASALIKEFTLTQKDGFKVKQLSLLAEADEKSLRLDRLSLTTANGTTLGAKAIIPQELLKGLKGGRASATAKLHIEKPDLRRLVSSSLYKSIDFLPDSMLDASINLSGNLQQLSIDTLSATVPLLSRIGARGTINNIDKGKALSAQIKFDGQIADVAHLIKKGATADTLAPQTLTLRGNSTYEHSVCSLALRALTGEGRAALRASYNIKEKSYSARTRLRGINLTKILPEVPLHQLTLSLKAEGRGLDPFDQSTRYNYDLQIDTLRYDTIALHKLHFTAKQMNGLSSIMLASHDPNLALQITAATHLDSTLITNSSHIELDNALLDKIGLTAAPLEASMTLDIEASTNMRQSHNLTIKGDGFRLVTPKKTFTPAPLHFEASTAPDTSYVNINTGDLKIKGTMASGYTALGEALKSIERLYSEARTSRHTLYYIDDYEKELPSFSLSIDCGQQNIASNFLRYNNIDFNSAKLDLKLNDRKEINGRGGIYGFKSESMQLDTVQFSLRQDSNLIRYFAGLRTRSLDPGQKKLKFYSALYGNIKKDSLTTNYIFRDNNERVGARLKLFTHLSPRNMRLHFDPDAIILGHTFRFNPDNYFSVGKDYAIRSNIELKDSIGSGVRLLSNNDSTQLRDLSAELFNVDLKLLTALLPFAPDISGTLNADIHYRDDDGQMLVGSDIQLSDIIYEGTPMGDGTAELAYLPKGKKQHYIDLTLHHNKNEVLNIYGDYFGDSISPTIDGEAVLSHFPLQLSDAFLKESGLSLGGYIDGNIKLKGKIESPVSNGEIHFDSVSAEAPIFGAKLHLKDDRVAVKNNKLTFKNFDIYAHSATPFNINGTIDIKNLLNPEFNLIMRATDYQIVNAKRKKGNMLYGNMSLDFNSQLRGPLDALQINGSATLLGSSDITYVMQDTPLATESELDGLVKFVNFADTTQINESEPPGVDFGNLTMNITLNIEEGARINADFDENRSSYIELQGGGNLNLTYTGEAGINLTGRYTLSDGQLKYTLPIIPLKTFNISDGSYINWTGDIWNPTVNITALERMTSSVTMDDGVSQAVAFDVGVVLTNTLDNMGLSFTLSAPENAAVQNELNAVDKETLNKYAVTMLITGAYLGSSGGITVSNALSSFLDARINDIAGNAMKSVDINVGITDVDNNQTGDTYKNYSFSFAKRFWNDRLTIVIGGEVNSGNNTERSNSFINNVSLEWKISREGNRYIRIFYDKNYESILEGEITETGVGYVYKRKLDKLTELFIFGKRKRTQSASDAPAKIQE
ncbi:MAG: translocation/assembly module TamB domain-containing protein [Bacteroidaceae bacterium]|nr:translocation/assembly module TamB domain-containing protein [Bacteroidaceae bacterium]